MRRSLALPLLAVLLLSLASGCPEREKVVDEVGGAPGRIMDQVKKAAERAQDQAAEREQRQLGEE
ncbi:MAG TPA: hypothetical protein VN033_14270 [Vulgatibacter sp.]|nr:hypothetical protein [Vulgatibacter sp.]